MLNAGSQERGRKLWDLCNLFKNDCVTWDINEYTCLQTNDLTLEYQTSDSASS